MPEDLKPTIKIETHREIIRGLNSAISSYTRICEEQQEQIINLTNQLRESASSNTELAELADENTQLRSEVAALRSRLEDRDL